MLDNVNPFMISELLDDLLLMALGCLKHTTLGEPSNVYTLSTEPGIDCCDSLIAWVREYRPVRRGHFPNENFELIQNCDEIGYMPVVVLSLLRPCNTDRALPIRNAPFISPNEKDKHARLIYEDMSVLMCCMLEQINDGAILGGHRYVENDIYDYIPKNVETESLGTCTRMDFPFLFNYKGCCLNGE